MRHKTNVLTTIFILAFTVVGCEGPLLPLDNCALPGEEVAQQEEATNNPEATIPKECVVPEQDLQANLEINATLRDFSTEKEAKMRKALERLKIVINSVEFKERVLNHKYNGAYTFVDNNGLDNAEVYEQILLGAEKHLPEEDEEIDVDITLYYTNNSTVGYTYPDSSRIWVNDKFFSTFTLGKVAANVAHEWTHKVGFGHDFSRTTKRNFSVPYGVGTIIQELVDGM